MKAIANPRIMHLHSFIHYMMPGAFGENTRTGLFTVYYLSLLPYRYTPQHPPGSHRLNIRFHIFGYVLLLLQGSSVRPPPAAPTGGAEYEALFAGYPAGFIRAVRA